MPGGRETISEFTVRRFTCRAVFSDNPIIIRAFVSHNFLISPSSDKRSLGSLIISTAGSILDLFYALVPVVRMEMMDLSPSLRMRFSNDCLYLSSEVLGLSKAVLSDVDRAVTASVDETIERFSLGGELWFEAALVSIVSLRTQ
jgi:centromere/kinetochore protein ZW10